MKRALATIGALLVLSAPAPAAESFTTIARDAIGDASLDTYDASALKVRRVNGNLEVRFDVPSYNNAIATGTTFWVEWRFATDNRFYAISASPLSWYSAQPQIDLSSLTIAEGDYVYTTLLELEGGFNEEDGYIWAVFPLEAIDARQGTLLRPARVFGEYQFWTYSTFFNLYDTVPIKKAYRIP